MNTATAAKLLGISQSTLKRWVKELELDMNRNDLGHFDFREEDLLTLKQIKKQIHNGGNLHSINISQPNIRKGRTTALIKNPPNDTLHQKINDLESKLSEKADKVVSYQLLTHRREIEELEGQLNKLTQRVEQLEHLLEEKNISKRNTGNGHSINQENGLKKLKKKSLITMLFGF